MEGAVLCRGMNLLISVRRPPCTLEILPVLYKCNKMQLNVCSVLSKFISIALSWSLSAEPE